MDVPSPAGCAGSLSPRERVFSLPPSPAGCRVGGAYLPFPFGRGRIFGVIPTQPKLKLRALLFCFTLMVGAASGALAQSSGKKAANPSAADTAATSGQQSSIGQMWDKATGYWKDTTGVSASKAIEWGLYAYVGRDLTKVYFTSFWQEVAYVGALYYILDPLSPNWEIETKSLPKQQFHLNLKMKRYAVGGAGEARQVFVRQAEQLMAKSKSSAYRELAYSEGMESSLLGSQRTAQGDIVLIK